MMTFEEFENEVLSAMYCTMYGKPKNWRDGQFVFNYIDEKYGVARSVQFIDGVDCFYDDSNSKSSSQEVMSILRTQIVKTINNY